MRNLFLFVFISISFLSFGQNTSFVVQKIEIKGNKITKEKIIHRELTFSIGDTLNFKDTLQVGLSSENNLTNTFLFNFSSVEFIQTDSIWKALVTVQERWYLWPQVTIQFQERNFSEWWKNKNFSRIDYGLLINRNNFLGLNQTLQGQFYVGFTQKFGLKYQIPYVTKKQRDGIKIATSYATQNEIFTGVVDNQMLYTKNDSDLLYSDYTAVVEYTRRTGFYQLQSWELIFKSIRGQNELQTMSKDYFGVERSSLNYFTLGYILKIDKRFSKNYPLTGSYLDFKFRQFGFGKIDQSQLSITHISSDARIFKQLKGRHYLALGSHLKYIPQKEVPFKFQDGLGFHDYVRGYEPYVIFGEVSLLGKLNYKLQLIAPKQFTLPLISKWKKFSKAHFAMYWNLYSDLGYVYNDNQSNSLNNEFLIGAGTGLDWVSYYDMVFRTEYSINKMGEHGFYISFVAPI